MRRIDGLFEQIVDWRNLCWATWAAARGKRQRAEVQEFLSNCDHNLNTIGRRLRNGDYQFSEYRSFAVQDTKRRLIHAPPFRDRVVHHAIISVVGPIFERGAIHHSYACRLGKGQHRALEMAAKWTRRGWWYGKIDVRKFYDSVDQQVLRRSLARRFREPRLLDLFDTLLQSYETAPGNGMPIGALTSQYLGNFYLDPFDRRITAVSGATHYLRYMDDCVVWARTRDELSEVRTEANVALGELKLEIKNGGEWNRCDRGIPLLGFVVYPNRIRMGKKGRQRLRKKFAQIAKHYRRDQISESEVQHRLTSLFSHASTADDINWRRIVLQFHDIGEGSGSACSGASWRRL